MWAWRKNRIIVRKPVGLMACFRSGFTLIELVVVVAIIALLISVLVKVGGNAVTSGRVSETRAVMETLNLAIEQFASEAPLKGISYDAQGNVGLTHIYQDRYGNNPPDELEGFDQDEGITGLASLAATGRYFVNDPTTLEDVDFQDAENQDIKAMVLAIKLYSPTAISILDKIPSRYKRTASDPDEYLDRAGDGDLDPDDEVLTYFVDTWGTPFQYFSLRDLKYDGTTFKLADAPSDSSNDRLGTATFLVQQNRGQPVLVSYGPDGPDQFSTDFQVGNEAPDLIQDFAGNDDTTSGVINNSLNADNVYLDPSLSERIYQPGTN